MSSTQSRAYHSITIGTKNTWDDWGLIPSSRPVFEPPTKKTSYVDIQGMNGTIDMSEALTGYPIYNNREGSFGFYVVLDCAQNAGKTWKDLYSTISNYLHGKTFQAILDDDPDYYYEGVFTVEKWDSKNDGSGNEITISYNVKPYKYSETETTIGPFTVGDTSSVDITNHLDRMPVSPKITATASGMTLTYTDTDGSDTTINLTQASNKAYPQVVFSSIYRSVYISMTGSGNITLKYRNGRL
jgi:predicted phage tail component-like protein